MINWVIGLSEAIGTLGIIGIVACIVNIFVHFIDNIVIEEVPDTPLYITKEVFLD